MPRRGRSLAVCVGEVRAESSAGERHVVTMIATIAVLAGKEERDPLDVDASKGNK